MSSLCLNSKEGTKSEDHKAIKLFKLTLPSLWNLSLCVVKSTGWNSSLNLYFLIDREREV